MSSLLLFISILATTLISTSSIPQTIKTMKSKNANGISLISYLLLLLGCLFWSLFGGLVGNVVVIISNLLIPILILPIIYYSSLNHKFFDKNKSFLLIFLLLLITLLFFSLSITMCYFTPWKKAIMEYSDSSNYLGFSISFLAGLTASLCFLPQTYQTVKTKNTKNISFFIYLMIFLGELLWVLFWTVTMIEEAAQKPGNNYDLLTYLPSIIFSTISFILTSSISIVKTINMIKKIDTK